MARILSIISLVTLLHGNQLASANQVGDVAANFESLSGGFGLSLEIGEVEFLTAEDCKSTTTCHGNNPSSPYGLTKFSYQNNSLLGTQINHWKLGKDQAVVLVFETPPDMAYFGFTPYVFSRYYPEQGRRMEPYASLGDTLNNLTVRHQLPLQSPYDKLTALVMTASLETYYKVATTLLVSGLLPMRTNPLIIPNNKVRLGNERDADTFQLLIRVAKPGIPAELDQYLETPPIYAYRVSTSNPSFTPITPPPIRPAGTGQDEKALTSTFHALSQAIALAHSDSLITPLKNNLSLPDPDFCLDTGKACHGDNRDSLYENVAFAPLTQHDNDYVIVYGVNHTLTQKTSYTNISVYDVNRLAGVVSRVEEDFAGSAAQYLDPVAYPYVDKLFVYKVARHCAPGELYCVSIPFDGNLSIPESAPISVVQRSYMEPATATAPLAAETIRLQGYRVSPSH